MYRLFTRAGDASGYNQGLDLISTDASARARDVARDVARDDVARER